MCLSSEQTAADLFFLIHSPGTFYAVASSLDKNMLKISFPGSHMYFVPFLLCDLQSKSL